MQAQFQLASLVTSWTELALNPHSPKEKNGREGGRKRMMKIVDTNVNASRPPERPSTGTPTVRANFKDI